MKKLLFLLPSFIIGPTSNASTLRFEHKLYPDTIGGYLYFDFMTLKDFDGCWELPYEVLIALENHGFDVQDMKEELYGYIDPALADEMVSYELNFESDTGFSI